MTVNAYLLQHVVRDIDARAESLYDLYSFIEAKYLQQYQNKAGNT